jgi:acyl carrier protein
MRLRALQHTFRRLEFCEEPGVMQLISTLPHREIGFMTHESSVMRIVKDYILDEFLPGEDPSKLTPTTPLVSTGIIDSLATLKLVTFLEREFDIQVKAHEADEEHLNTLQTICELVDSKR